jgi:hypothetical protein
VDQTRARKRRGDSQQKTSMTSCLISHRSRVWQLWFVQLLFRQCLVENKSRGCVYIMTFIYLVFIQTSSSGEGGWIMKQAGRLDSKPKKSHVWILEKGLRLMQSDAGILHTTLARQLKKPYQLLTHPYLTAFTFRSLERR